MKVYVMSMNGHLSVFKSQEEIVDFFKKEGVKEFQFEDEYVDDDSDDYKKFTVEEGVDFLLKSWGEVVVDNQELCEMGDDYVRISLEDFDI